jgi:phosphate starvation-inducible protein PhoH and related proteins
LKEIKLPAEFTPLEFYGAHDVILEMLRGKFPLLKIIARGNDIKIEGEENQILQFEAVIEDLKDQFREYGILDPARIESYLQGNIHGEEEAKSGSTSQKVIVHGQRGIIVKARTPGQQRMVSSSMKNDVVFAIGPAGTGKTYTAVALAVRALKAKEVKKIVLTRPAVEAGENLGFLPGDIKEKIDPYLRPLYDALYDMIPGEKLRTLIENHVIEVAPLAFMRGRTLDNAFVILDESQNATKNQLKMFLTRMGPSAKFILTGDITQIDLPNHQPSGLIHSIDLLKGIKGIEFVYLNSNDVVRHRLVKDIITAYSKETKSRKISP